MEICKTGYLEGCVTRRVLSGDGVWMTASSWLTSASVYVSSVSPELNVSQISLDVASLDFELDEDTVHFKIKITN